VRDEEAERHDRQALPTRVVERVGFSIQAVFGLPSSLSGPCVKSLCQVER
jgi:hypothetical protein